MILDETFKALFSYDAKSGKVTRLVTTSSRAKKGDVVGHDSHGYLQVSVNGEHVQLHRLAWFLHTGKWPEGQIDHKNRIRSDNKWCNLREATSQENTRNRGKQSNNTSGFVGVSFNKRQNLWEAYCKIGGKKKHLGFYATDILASHAYEDYARVAFGHFYMEKV